MSLDRGRGGHSFPRSLNPIQTVLPQSVLSLTQLSVGLPKTDHLGKRSVQPSFFPTVEMGAGNMMKPHRFCFQDCLSGSMVKNPPVDVGDVGSIPGSRRHGGRIPWRKAWQPTPVFWPGESHRKAWCVIVHEATNSRVDLATKQHLPPTHVRFI